MEISLLKEIGTSAICDAMNILGLGIRALSNNIVPLNQKHNFCFGPLFTIKGDINGTLTEKMNGMKVMDNIVAGCVILIDINGGSGVGHWGELMTAAAMSKGAKGVVTNGGCRDKQQIANANFPVFCSYTTPCEAMTLYYMKECNVPLQMKNSLDDLIEILPGDFIMADDDGVVIIPKDAKEDVFLKASQIRTHELKAKEMLLLGRSVHEVFSSLNIA